MPKLKENSVSKRELMKRADYRFPEIMNKTEACFYLWGHLDLARLKRLTDRGIILLGVEDGKEVITKKELDRYIESITKRVA